jgi:hypothetical protein
MASDPKRVDALQLIFSVFLGALLVIVIGVGVWTFYPQPYGPDSPEQKKIDQLYRQQEQINVAVGGKSLDTTQSAEVKRIQDEIEALDESMQGARDDWAVTTSIILLSFATILMAISLFLPEHMRVFSNGILLGGLFTIVYGTGWSFAGGDSRARFFVVLVALLLSVAFGYLRFIRGRAEKAAPVTPALATAEAGAALAATDAAALGALTARVEALEARAAAAAAALGGSESTAEKD